MNIKDLTPRQLLNLYTEVLNELRKQEIIRSTNNPVADYAELLFEKGLDLKRTPKSTKGHDAISQTGEKYEIKARRLTPHNVSRQLSALRGLNEGHFTYLAGILFNENFTVWKACLVPHATVLERSTYREHTNAWIFLLKDEVWSIPGVIDVTSQLANAEMEIGG